MSKLEKNQQTISPILTDEKPSKIVLVEFANGTCEVHLVYMVNGVLVFQNGNPCPISEKRPYKSKKGISGNISEKAYLLPLGAVEALLEKA